MLCLWNVPRKCARAELFAVQAALAMVAKWAELSAPPATPSRSRSSPSPTELKIRVGIASSAVTFGNFGSETMKVCCFHDICLVLVG